MRDKFILLIVLIVMNAANAAAASQKISSSVINKLHQRSLILLAQYDLNPTNKGPIYKEPEVDFILPMNQSYVLDSIDSNRHNHSKLGFTSYFPHIKKQVFPNLS